MGARLKKVTVENLKRNENSEREGERKPRRGGTLALTSVWRRKLESRTCLMKRKMLSSGLCP